MSMEKARRVFVNHLASHIEKKISGANQDRVVGANPEDLFFVARLGPIKDVTRKKYSFFEPNQIGVEFLLKNDRLREEKLRGIVQTDFFIRVLPTLKEQREIWMKEFLASNREISGITFENIRDESGTKVPVAKVFQKIRVEFPFEIALRDVLKPGEKVGKKNFEEITKRVIKNLEKQIDCRTDLYAPIAELVTNRDLADEKAWRNFLQSNLPNGKIEQVWSCNLSCEVRKYDEEHARVSITFQNRTQEEQSRKELRINTLFNCKMTVSVCTQPIVPVELRYLKDDYKYDREQIAIGKNCSVKKLDDYSVETVTVPVFEQYRLKTRDDVVQACFSELAEDPFPILESISWKMGEEHLAWSNDLKRRKGHLSEKAYRQYLQEVNAFAAEKERFDTGVQVLRDYPDVLRAFKLMNRAFANSAKGYVSWRLFQIVFIVSVIPDIAAREYKELESISCGDEVDLIYFPTGGGKTETYLGTVVFNMFFDRIRGKKSGVTAIMKFPLRLLSLQQLQRAADITAQAELIRRKETDLKDSDPFSVGYFVGSNNTPNKLIDENGKDLASEIAELPQNERNDKFMIVDRCSFCGKRSVYIDVLVEERRLIHRCGNRKCSEDILPIYIVDREVFRYLPTFIISTLDKSALMGLQRNFRNILGNVSGFCSKHGYTSMGKCTESEFCGEIPEPVALYDPAPSLVIQDELHLVRESLGAFNAHYETFFHYFLRNLSPGKRPIKVVAATATISDYEQQIYHLYYKNARRFPSPSPYLDRGFYSYVDKEDLNRIIIGVAPYGKTPIYSILDIIRYFREKVHEYWMNPEKMKEIEGMPLMTVEEYRRILRDYWVVLEYNQIKNEGMQVVQSVRTMVNEKLKEQNIQEFKVRTMTGDDTFGEIREVLAEIEKPNEELPNVDLIAATSMISHGVDADAFNFMVFYGVPKSTAEYIQAYSRAGRKHPALIIMVFNSNREKDSSYNQHFVKFNEYKDILVESVPINRWANNAVVRTLPGLFAALVLLHYDFEAQTKGYKIYMLSGLQKALGDGIVPHSEVLAKQLIEAYGANDPLGTVYKKKIEDLVKKIIERLKLKEVSVRNDLYLTEALNSIGYPVMRSLRDTDVPVPVVMEWPDSELVKMI